MIKPEIKLINNNIFLFINKSSPIIAIESFILKDLYELPKKDIGLDHLLEHIIACAYKKCNMDCLDFFKKKGIKNNAYVTNNIINYNISGFFENIDIMLDYIFKVTQFPEFNEKIIEREKKIVENELLMYIDNINYAFNNLINFSIYRFTNFKYLLDYKLQINNLYKPTYNKKYLLEYFYKNYNNIIYVISGNTNNIENKIKKIFKSSPKNSLYLNKTNNILNKPLFLNQKKILYLLNPERKSTLISFNFTINYQFNEKKTIFIEIIKSVLKTIFTKILRTEKKYIYGSKIMTYNYLYGTHIRIDLNTKNINLLNTINDTIQIINQMKKNINHFKVNIESSKKLFLIDYLTKQYNIYDYLNF